MNMIITTGKHSYMVNEIDSTIEVGSFVFIPENKTWHMITAPGVMTPVAEDQVDNAVKVSTAEELTEILSAGGDVKVEANIDAPTAITVKADTTLNLNGKEITIKEDIVGDGVFKAVSGTLTIEGEGVINGVGKNDWNMGVWATENGKIVINGGLITNVGATATDDPDHFDLIYASGNGQIEINGGEFKCETPKWTLNIKDKDRTTASIVVKGGKFYGFDPSNSEAEGPGTSFVAEGYVSTAKENDIYIVESLEAASIAYNQNNGKYYLTITEAINEANDGDTIVVKPGVYDEKIAPWVGDSTHKVEKSITLLGANADNEEWDSENETVLTGGLYLGYDDTKTRDHTIVIKGFTFKGKSLKTACQKHVIIENNRFYDIEDTSPAVLVMDAKEGSVSIRNNVVQDCSAAGIETRRANDVVIENNIVTNTKSNGILMSGAITGTSSVKNNTITNWTPAMAEGRAIRVVLSNGDLVANNNTLKYEDTALEEYIKVTGTGTINASANYWNGLNPLENNIYLGLAETVTDEISSYYSDENMTKLIQL